jgi:UDP-N-acetylglucosamine 2-epimerase (non-hydrolysing)
MTGSIRDRRGAPRLTSLEGGRSRTAEPRAPLTTVLHVVARPSDRHRLNPVITALNRWALFHQVLVHVSTPPPGVREVADPADAIMLMSGPVAGSRPARDGERIARVVTQFERVINVVRPNLIVVPSGTAEAFGCALAAAKQGVPIAVLDAGMRIGTRGDRAELDRALTDRLGDLLLTSTDDARHNLLVEGVPDTRVRVVGSALVDTIRLLEHSARARAAWLDHGVEPQDYVLLILGGWPTSRRVSRQLGDALRELAARASMIAVAETAGNRPDRAGRTLRALLAGPGTRFAPAWPYLDRLSLALGAGAIVTDVGDPQEEASVLGVPCYTLAARTERLITVTHGTNRLVGARGDGLAGVHPIRRPPAPHGIPLWDGHAAERAAEVLVAHTALRGGVQG